VWESQKNSLNLGDVTLIIPPAAIITTTTIATTIIITATTIINVRCRNFHDVFWHHQFKMIAVSEQET